MIARILAAVDSSPRAPGVFAAAREAAALYRAALHVYRAIYVPQDVPAAGHSSDGEAEALMRRAAAEHLAELVAGAPEAIIEPADFEAPQPWRAILSAAERIDADLIVIGSHEYGGMDRIIGTTAAKVVNHATRNVLVVHERHTGPPPPQSQG
jgi:nucleotide-binding universal stress UspA family protein